MVAVMVITLPMLATTGLTRYVRVSLPWIDALLDGKKYQLPEDMPAPRGLELRAHRRPRAPSMKTLVRLALARDSAEQLGKRLRRRYERQQQRSRQPADKTNTLSTLMQE
jgi:hypothetical protein